MDKEQIQEALRSVKYPGFTRDIVSFGLIKSIEIEGGKVNVKIALSTGDQRVPGQIKQEVEQVLRGLEGVEEAQALVSVTKPDAPSDPEQGQHTEAMQEVRWAVALASGKGGVGKSTISANLACALERILAEEGRPGAVGVMDCDIYGPSIPLMLGANAQPEVENNMLEPVENFGLKVMSMGLLVDESTPVVWRGPMIMKTIQQFAMNVNWGQLEVLIVDLPPGTGDPHLSLVQTIPLDGALIATTPQTASVNVSRRGARMFDKVSVPILGVVENMSYLLGANGERQYLFGEGGGKITADDLQTELLAQIPIDQEIREGGDNGVPITIGNPESAPAKEFQSLARQLLSQLRS